MAIKEYDVIISAEGNGDYTTLAEAESAYDGGPYMAYVKMGHYAPGATLTISSDNCVWIFESGTYFNSAITVSGNQVALILGSGCNIAGLVTLSGTGCSLICENGADLDGISIIGARSYTTGGGWDTITDGATTVMGIAIDAVDCIVENISCQTTAGGGSGYDGVNIVGGGDRTVLSRIRVVDSDDDGLNSLGDNPLLIGCVVLDADDEGIAPNGPGTRVIGCYSLSTDSGLYVFGLGDDSVVVGNIFRGSASIIHADAENCVVVGNRTNGAIVDNSSTSTVAQNDATAF